MENIASSEPLVDSEPDRNVSVTGFITSLALNVILLLVAFSAFAVIRCCAPTLYAPRWMQQHARSAPRDPLKEYRSRDAMATLKVPKPEHSICALLWQVLLIPEGAVLGTAGLDSYCFLILLQHFMAYFGLVTGIYSMMVLMPLNITAPTPPGVVQSQLDYISIASIQDGDQRLWAHAFGVYLFSLGAAVMVLRLWHKYLPLRYAWLALPQPSRFSVMVLDLPPTVTDDVALHSYMEQLYPGAVHSACIVTQATEVAKEVEKRDAIVRKLERVRLQLEAARSAAGALAASRVQEWPALTPFQTPAQPSPGTGADTPTTQDTERANSRMAMLETKEDAGAVTPLSPITLGAATPAAASADMPMPRAPSGRLPSWTAPARVRNLLKQLHHLEVELSKRDRRLYNYRHYGMKTPPPGAAATGGNAGAAATVTARLQHAGVFTPSSAGFVTFNDLATAAIAPQVCNTMRTLSVRDFSIRRAPEPRDVSFGNIGMLRNERRVRQRIATLAALGLCLLYLPLTSLIATLTSLDSLATFAPFLRQFVQISPLAQGFVQGFLPSLVLTLVLLLVPPILRFLAEYGGARSHSDAVLEVLRYYWAFRFFTTFLVFSITSSVWQALDDILNSPLSVPTILARTLPDLAGFFAQYVLLQGLTSIPLGSLLRLWPLIQYAFCRPRVITRRDKQELVDYISGSLSLDDSLPNLLVLFTIGLCYAPISPLLSPVCLLVFAVAWWTYKYNILYVYGQEFQTGGAFLPVALNRVLAACLMLQLLMIGVLALKAAPGPSASLLPLPLLTYAFWVYIERNYRRDAEHLPIDAARNPDLVRSRVAELQASSWYTRPLSSPSKAQAAHAAAGSDSDSSKVMVQNALHGAVTPSAAAADAARPALHLQLPRLDRELGSDTVADAAASAHSHAHSHNGSRGTNEPTSNGHAEPVTVAQIVEQMLAAGRVNTTGGGGGDGDASAAGPVQERWRAAAAAATAQHSSRDSRGSQQPFNTNPPRTAGGGGGGGGPVDAIVDVAPSPRLPPPTLLPHITGSGSGITGSTDTPGTEATPYDASASTAATPAHLSVLPPQLPGQGLWGASQQQQQDDRQRTLSVQRPWATTGEYEAADPRRGSTAEHMPSAYDRAAPLLLAPQPGAAAAAPARQLSAASSTDENDSMWAQSRAAGGYVPPSGRPGSSQDTSGGVGGSSRADGEDDTAAAARRAVAAAQRSVYLHPCFRGRFDLPYEADPELSELAITVTRMR